VLSRDWLGAAQAPPVVREATCEDVRARLDELPDYLRRGAAAADTLLGLLPIPALRAAVRLPGVGEFARIVESLTAVSYFDLVTADLPIPAPRRDSVALEPLA